MKWWIKKNGCVEGPYSVDDMRKRIALNMIGSLDRVSNDACNWRYLKDTELWRPVTTSSQSMPQQATPPIQQIERSDVPREEQHSESLVILKPIDHSDFPRSQKPPIPERLRVPETNPQKSHLMLLFVIGGICAAALLAVVAGIWIVRSSTRTVAKTDKERAELSVSDSATDVASKNKNVEDSASVRDAVALIECKEANGTGFLLEMGGKIYLVSNEHVVRSMGKITARLIDGTTLQLGEFSVAENGRDLARFEVFGCKRKPLTLRTSDPNYGEQVAAYGNSLGAGVITESKGFVQASGPEKIETNVEIVHGNSGGPLVDISNMVVGVSAFLDKTESGNDELGNKNTRYDDTIRRFAVRLNGVKWKSINRIKYEEQVAALAEFEVYWNVLRPFLVLESGKVKESSLTYSDIDGQRFGMRGTGFDEMLKEVAKAYERRQKAITRYYSWVKGQKSFEKNLLKNLNYEIDQKQITEAVAKKAFREKIDEYEKKTQSLFEKMKAAYKKLITIRKEALIHAQSYLSGRTWDAPQIANGYSGYGAYGENWSVAWYMSGIKFAADLMNQNMKDLDKRIKEIEEDDNEDEEKNDEND